MISSSHHATGVLVHAYALCSELGVKAADDPMAWVAADWALTIAQALGDPILIGIAARQTAIAMRRTGHHRNGLRLLEDTAATLDADAGDGAPRLLATLGALHTAAAFNHAQSGNTHAALDAIGQAHELARRIDSPDPQMVTPFSTITVIEYEISVRNALDDPGGALTAAKRIQPGALPTRERFARYGLDVARAWHQQGRSDRAIQALLAAECCGPEDVRRPSVRALIADLASEPNPPVGARALATRTGASI
jgi:hypothetical protein